MKEIISGDNKAYYLIQSYLTEDENNTDIEYVVSKYVIFEKIDDGYLLFHSISWSLYLLTEDEYNNILNFDGV